MLKRGVWMVLGLMVAVLVVASVAQDVQARPKYFAEFKNAYEKVAAEADKVKCNVCHFGQEKKNRNDYGKAVADALGEKNVMDVEKIKEALKKAEKEKSATAGKTFGDLINDGKLPGKSPE
jgi:cytochrome c553